MSGPYDDAMDWWEGESGELAETAYGALPVLSRDVRETIDQVPDRHGGKFRMGAQPGWSPAREGYDRPPRPAPEAWELAGRIVCQPVFGCTECGGIVAVRSSLATRQPDLYAWRSEVDPAYRALGDDETCAGCHRQGSALEARVREAGIAARVAEARRGSQDPWSWTRSASGDRGLDEASA